MDLKTLKIKHPETYAAAVAEGEAKEHDRVSAHLMCGQKFDAMPIAIKAIKEKSGLTSELQDEYLSMATGRLETRARQLDSDEAGAALEGAATPADLAQDNSDKVAAAMGLTAPKKIAPVQTIARPAAKTASDNGDLVVRAMGLTGGAA
ncbi:MAG: hypothetical protein ABUL62_31860 [Myxococcales bacterium]